MRKKPPGELFELLERTLDVLRATKEALLEQRREIRSLATAVDTLRSRVDQLVQNRTEPPATEPEPESAHPESENAESRNTEFGNTEFRNTEFRNTAEPEPSAGQLQAQPEPEAELEPVPEPEPATEPEPEPDLLPAAEWLPDSYGREDSALEQEAGEDSAIEESAVEDSVIEDSAIDEPAEPAFNFDGIGQTSTDQTVEHVLMLSTAAGYRIVIGDGAQPTPTIEVDGVVFQVSGRMGSPFPGDTRTAYFATRSDSAVAPGA